MQSFSARCINYQIKITDAFDTDVSDRSDTAFTIHSATEGDIDHDGEVDLNDLILSLQVLTGIASSPDVHKEADFNFDGRIGFHEVLYIMDKASGLRDN